MKYNNTENVKHYLNRFNQIVNQMAYQMLSVQPVNNITINFIRCMIPHHQAAIYMCQNLLQYTIYPPLQEIANRIIVTQTKGIEQMKEILRTTVGFQNLTQDVDSYMKKYMAITRNMLYKMNHSLRSAYINLNFVSEMIPHHEGAVLMCQNLLQYRIDPRLKQVALNIIREQSAGIKQLEAIKSNLSQ